MIFLSLYMYSHIGGGGILVPLLILVYGFHPKYAIPLSNLCIVGSSITNIVLNVTLMI